MNLAWEQGQLCIFQWLMNGAGADGSWVRLCIHCVNNLSCQPCNLAVETDAHPRLAGMGFGRLPLQPDIIVCHLMLAGLSPLLWVWAALVIMRGSTASQCTQHSELKLCGK